ncbi:hypothetical protein IMZ08_07300 [Bacillus luteolus]|uniref:GIY-YIG domain-containing protein n=2 Tax=Litchfieldia luteola TaxID=682179 RepID=A0ABR9QHA3_9BACI|nr:hypothetical protein [Cytobacillus luteolus]MBE4907858.1 hypothetical protein [Cytobacillus luteolus]
MSKVSIDPMSILINETRIQRPKYITEIYHWDREMVNNNRWKNSAGIYVFFDKAGNVAYVGKTAPFGDSHKNVGRPRRRRKYESRIKRHFNGKGKSLMWEYYYKVRLYEFTDFSSRDIYESWWIGQLKPYGNKSGRYYSVNSLLPNSRLKKNNWSQYQKDAFIKRVSPENIALWRYWKSTTTQDMDINTWISTQKMGFISSLATQVGQSVFDFYRGIRKKARK